MIVYTVTCRHMRVDVVDSWLAWILGGHLDEVLAGGAESAEVVRLDLPDDSPHVAAYAVHYRFPDWESFRTYERDHAPRLRADGLERFPLTMGLSYERTVGEVIATVGELKPTTTADPGSR